MLLSDWPIPVAPGALPTRTNTCPLSSSLSVPPLRYAVLGAGFAGLSVVWHMLKHCPKDLNLRIDIYDEVGIGGGASGVSGGLLHPYSPKAKILWKGAECWRECLMLLSVAENAAISREQFQGFDGFIVRRRGILRPATSTKNLSVLHDNAQNFDASCRIVTVDKHIAQELAPHISLHFNTAFYMPQAVNVHPMRYLQALFFACEDLVEESSASGRRQKQLHLHKKSIQNLKQLGGDYDAITICLGAKVNMLPELSGRLPLRTCRGVIAHLQLLDNIREEYPRCAPSILSDAWLAVQGTHSLYMGSTWEWKYQGTLHQTCPQMKLQKLSKNLCQRYLLFTLELRTGLSPELGLV